MLVDRLARCYSTRSKLTLKRPAYAVKHIIEHADAYKASIQARGVELYRRQSIDDLVAGYHALNTIKHARYVAGAERNAVVARVKESVGKAGVRDALPVALRDESERAKKRLAELDRELKTAEREFDELLDSVPNLVEPAVLQIKGEYEEISRTLPNQHHPTHSDPPRDPPSDPQRDHVTIGTKLGLLDIANASRVSGVGNAYLVGQGALLEQALVAYALQRCAHLNFQVVSPPTLVRPEYSAACGFRPRGEASQIYEVAGQDLVMSGTAEIPLASQLALQSIERLPRRHCGVSRAFRAEAGSRGTDTRGLYRLHEFLKVEMFVWSEPSQSSQMLQELVATQNAIFGDLLGEFVPLRTIRLGPGDLGAPAYEKYDVEAWMPGRGSWGELSSASNCLDFQARRLHTSSVGGEFVHTLNGTALAVPRVIVAILENGWDEKTQSVRLPKVLWPYMGCEALTVHSK